MTDILEVGRVAALNDILRRSLSGGTLVKLGQPYTKFADPAAGNSIIWTRAKYSF